MENKEDLKYLFPIDKSKIPKDFMSKFEIKKINFKGDRLEKIRKQDIVELNPDLLIKFNRDITSEINEWFKDQVTNKRVVGMNIKGSTRSGKSLIALKIIDNLSRQYKKPFNPGYSVCANQNEYRLKLLNCEMGDAFQIDENAFAQVGDGAMTERAQLVDVQNIIAKKNIHTIYITPRTFLETNVDYGLDFYERDIDNWLSKFLVFDLKSPISSVLGYIVINVGSLFNDYGCFFNRMLGGCTNPNRLKLIEITDTELVFENHKEMINVKEERHSIDYLKYSSCIPENNKNLKDVNESLKDDKDIPCPFYRLCKHPLCGYEKKKDGWIKEEMQGGMGARQKDRFRVALELIQKLGYYDEKTMSFRIKAPRKSIAMQKVKLQLPKLTNTKLNKTELKDLFEIIESLEDYLVLKEICGYLGRDTLEEVKKIDNYESFLQVLDEIE